MLLYYFVTFFLWANFQQSNIHRFTPKTVSWWSAVWVFVFQAVYSMTWLQTEFRFAVSASFHFAFRISHFALLHTHSSKSLENISVFEKLLFENLFVQRILLLAWLVVKWYNKWKFSFEDGMKQGGRINAQMFFFLFFYDSFLPAGWVFFVWRWGCVCVVQTVFWIWATKNRQKFKF